LAKFAVLSEAKPTATAADFATAPWAAQHRQKELLLVLMLRCPRI